MSSSLAVEAIQAIQAPNGWETLILEANLDSCGSHSCAEIFPDICHKDDKEGDADDHREKL